MKESDLILKRFEERYEKEHNIFCPYCGAKQSEEIRYNHVSYWADDGEKEETCTSCDKQFIVEEHVDRTWETRTK